MMRSQQYRVGVIGGGQLAWMMAPGAAKLGISLVVQTPSKADPAVAIAEQTILAPVADVDGTRHLAEQCDVITFENEFVDLPALRSLAQAGVHFLPSLDALAPLLDKSTQRQFLEDHGLPNPPFVTLEDDLAPDEVQTRLARLGWPLVLKTRRLGYDGQGTFILKTAADFEHTWAKLNRAPVILEAFIPFEKELAVMVARSPQGTIVVYPVVETQQVNQVCRRVIAPAPVNPSVVAQIDAIARTLVEKLDFVGVLGVEFFLAPGDRVLINEVAPRTHNSGHYTLDACITSQFEQQLRAVCGLPLGTPDLTCAQAVMVNLLGFETADSDYHDIRQRLTQVPNATVYWYGKTASRPGRKLGHVTLCLTAEADPNAAIAIVESLWYPKIA